MEAIAVAVVASLRLGERLRLHPPTQSLEKKNPHHRFSVYFTSLRGYERGCVLRDVLAALSATTPRLVFQKTLNRADVDPNQTRLLIPCRPGRKHGVITDANALTAFLTADEKDSVCGDSYRRRDLQGMQVPAYDRHGRRFDMRLWMVRSQSAYRLFGSEWRRFLADNQLEEAMAVAKEMGRKLEVELWAFRSVELLPRGDRPPPRRGSRDGDFDKKLRLIYS
ncbi:unnamed protein product [Miscanthus lutarioriparius]|uniref:TF-B3 domain-containing protein n=1 Tax=Miscanthus lutarioriparius TaxID=422564 RepID=A0A811RXW3_9POAL|nr:unnamed protein product [Miscanthus lutarioriparius]